MSSVRYRGVHIADRVVIANAPKSSRALGKKNKGRGKKKKGKGKWIQKALKPRRVKGVKGLKGRRGKGTFTAEAKKKGLTAKQLLKKVEKNPTAYSKLTRQRASLMKTLTSFRKMRGGKKRNAYK